MVGPKSAGTSSSERNILMRYRTPASARHAPVRSDAQMPTMNPIKISYADDGGSEICRHFLKRAEYPHAISNSSFSPSCASPIGRSDAHNESHQNFLR